MSDLDTRATRVGNGRKAQPKVEDNVVDLLGRLTHQGAHLAQEQVELMQAEVREAAQDVKQAIGAFAGAAVVGMAGLGVLLLGVGYLLGTAFGLMWLGVVIVGVVALLVAWAMYGAARKKLGASHLKPDRTIRTVEDTPDAVTGNLDKGAADFDSRKGYTNVHH